MIIMAIKKNNSILLINIGMKIKVMIMVIIVIILGITMMIIKLHRTIICLVYIINERYF